MMILEISLAAGYLVGGGMSAAVFSEKAWNQGPGPFFASILWPVTMPSVLTYWGVNRIKEKGLCLPSRQPKAIAYAEAPLSILASMVAQRIIAKPTGFTGRGDWKSEKIFVNCDFSSTTFDYIEVDGNRFRRTDFKSSDQRAIIDALTKARKLEKEQRAANALASQNNKALDVIEKLAGIPVSVEPTLLSVEKSQ